MATDLLPDDQETRTDGQPLSPAEQAQLDQIEAGLREDDSAPEPEASPKASTTTRVANAAGFVKKNRKWFIGGATGIGILIPIFMFFFWLMLFKNVHIKNLYVTYRWAQFNRGINKSLGEALKQAKVDPAEAPAGDAATTVEPNATPDENLRNANAEELSPDKINPEDPAQVEKVSNRVTAVEQTVEGTSQPAIEELGISREVKPPPEGEGNTPDEKAKSAKEEAAKAVDEDLAKPGESGAGDPPSSLKDSVEEAKQAEAKGVDAKTAAADSAEKFIGGQGSAAAILRDIQGIGVAATFYCIFRDIYVTAKDQLNKIVLAGAANTAMEVNKTADAQQLGTATLDQAGAVSSKFDNGKDSFTGSCGYARATQSSNPACKEIDPQYTVNALVNLVGDGVPGAAVKTFDTVFDPPKVFGVDAIEPVCSLVMSTPGQVVLAATGIAGLVISDGGWQAAGRALVTGVAAFGATAGGKALIANAILTYGGGLYKNLSPYDMGNLTDMGNDVTANAACKNSYCVKATPQQAAALDNQYRQERIAANKKRPLLAKLFDANSPDSSVSRMAMNAPATPQAMIGRMSSMFAAMVNPMKLAHATGTTAVAVTSADTAYAADANNPYGLGNATYVPPNLLTGDKWDSINAWASGQDISALDSKYGSCAAADYTKVAGGEDNSVCDSNDGTYMKYMEYKFQQNASRKLALSYNDQSNMPSGSSSQNTSTAASPGSSQSPEACRTNPTGNIKILCEAMKYDPYNYGTHDRDLPVKEWVARFKNRTLTDPITLDCSSLVSVAIYEAFNVDGDIPPAVVTNPQTNALDNKPYLKHITVAEAKPGDLVVQTGEHVSIVYQNSGGVFKTFMASNPNNSQENQIFLTDESPGNYNMALRYTGPGADQ